MPEKSTKPPAPRAKRPWWLRLLRGIGWAFLVLAVIHHPLIVYGGPLVARYFARKQHLDVRFALSGNLFTRLLVRDLRVKPDGSGPTPVERIDIDFLRFDYSLRRLIRKGAGEALSNYELRRADLRFVALPSKTHEEKESKKSIVETLRTILAQPAAYSDRVLIDDFSIRVESPNDVTDVRKLDAFFDPNETGYLRIGRLQVPKLPVLEGINATTTYVKRNMYIRGVQLGPHILLEEVNYDASQRAAGRGLVAIRGQLFGGTMALTLTGQEQPGEGDHLKRRYDTHLVVTANHVGLRDALEYFDVGAVPFDRLQFFELDFGGDPEKPRTWVGTTKVAVEQLAAGRVIIPTITTSADFKGGQAHVSTEAKLAENVAKVNAVVDLPERIDNWMSAGANADVEVSAPNLSGAIAGALPDAKTRGTLIAQGKVDYRDRRATVAMEIAGSDVVFNTQGAAKAKISIHGTQQIAQDNSAKIEDLEGTLTAELSGVHAGTFAVDTATLSASAANRGVEIRELTIKRGANSISATARASLPIDFSRLDQLNGEAQATVAVPVLAEFGVQVLNQTLGGTLNTRAQAKFADGKVDGVVNIAGSEFAIGDFRTGDLSGRVLLHDHFADLENLTLLFSGSDRLAVKGRYDIEKPNTYSGAVTLAFKNVAKLQPLLEQMKVTESVAGALDVKWTGEGELADKVHRGEGAVEFTNGKYGKFDLQEVHATGRYTANSADADLRVRVGATRLDTNLEWREQRLTLTNLELRQGDQRALTGKVATKLPEAGHPIDPLTLPVEINLDADKLDIEKLMTSLGHASPAGGLVSMHLVAIGMATRPEVELTAQARGLKATAAAKVEPADAELTLTYRPGELKLNATARQPLVQPIAVTAHLPLDLERVIADKKLPADLPVEASVKLPTTSLAAIPKFVPQVRRVDGTAAVDLMVGGTVEKPELSGEAIVSLRSARMVQESIPGIGQFDARLAFAKNALTVERFRGEVGGGTFELLGNILLTRLDEPVFDLHAKAAQILVKRDESITVRADADIKIGGSLHEGALTGDVFITQSRFFKEIDILPIGLPGRPKPEPKSVPAEPDIKVPAPFDKWKIDVRIKTRDTDPFLIRGNLANGEVAVNLRLANDGPKPWLEGTVTLNRFVGSLPFSRLTVDDGHIYFGKATPINQPTLDIRAASKIREYTVTAYIFGNAQAPTIQFVSEPPLPHADIVALIATGTTSNELAGSADVLASRAALLAAQSLWKKVFKPNASKAALPASTSQRGDAAGFMERFDLALGGMDIKTGAREATAQFKVNDQIYVVGELDTQGRYTGALKYLLRFR